jgi:hypothetical protein
MSAEGSQASLSYIEETTWGETPDTGDFTGINFNSESFALTIDNQISNAIRPDRQTIDLVQTGASAEGGFESELQYGNLSALYEGVFWNKWSADEDLDGNPAIGTDSIKNGTKKTSYTFQRVNHDIGTVFMYAGMVGSTLNLTIEEGSPIMANMTFIGKDEKLGSTPRPITDPVVTPVFSSVSSVSSIIIDGQPLKECLLQSVGFTLDNKAAGRTGVGVLGFCSVAGKSIEVTGDITLYFTDATYYQKYLNSEAFGLEIELTDNVGNVYKYVLPHCKFDSATANVTGKDDDVMLNGTFVAIMDPVKKYTVGLSRTPYVP